LNSFGLGLVLDFTDNASAGMMTASRNMQMMSSMADQVTGTINATSQSVTAMAVVGSTLSNVGSSVMNTGKSIIDMVTQSVTGLTKLGTEIQGTRMTLSTLYGSAEAGEKKFAEAQKYAQQSVFELKNILPAITMMKAVGIEAMDDITTSSGKTKQKLMDYASDIATVFPNMRNSYGTGVQAAMGALKEYIAEGNKVSLKRGAGLDIEQILGEKKGGNIKERTQQVADMTEKLNIAGMTVNMLGTPTQRLSNMQDILYNTLVKIVDSGVFDEYSKIVNIFADGLDRLNNSGDLDILAKSVGQAVVSIMKPLEGIAHSVVNVVNAFVGLVKTHPILAKLIIMGTTLTGVVLVISGAVLKLSGGLLVLMASLQMLNLFANGQIAIMSSLASAFGMFATAIVPVILGVITLKEMWSRNMFGMRDATLNAVSDIQTIFSLLSDAWNDRTLSADNFEKARRLGLLPFIESVLDLKYNLGDMVKGFKSGFNGVFDTFSKISNKVSTFKVSVMGMAKTFGDFVGKFTGIELSPKWNTLGKVLGGIVGALTIALPVIKLVSVAIGLISSPIALVVAGLVGLYLLWKSMWKTNAYDVQGFVESIMKNIEPVLMVLIPKALESLKKTFRMAFLFIKDIADTILIPVFSVIIDVVLDMWSYIQRIWNRYGKSILKGVVSFVVTVVSLVNELWQAIKPFITRVIALVSRLWNSSVGPFINQLMGFCASLVNALLAIWRVALYPLLKYVIRVFVPMFLNAFMSVIDILSSVVGFVFDFAKAFLRVLTGIIDFITGVFTGNWTLAWNGLKDIVLGIFDGIVAGVKGAVNLVISCVNALISGIYTGVSGVMNTLGSVAGTVGDVLGKDWDFKVPSSPPQIPYLNTGGYVKKEGISYLHPNEVVVKSKYTDLLGSFLGDYDKSSKSGGESKMNIVPENKSSKSNSIPKVVPVTHNNKNSKSETQVDNSITIENGAVQINCQKATSDTKELEAMATKIMKIIERKVQIKKMARTNKPKSKAVFG
jgi:phage-related protein